MMRNLDVTRDTGSSNSKVEPGARSGVGIVLWQYNSTVQRFLVIGGALCSGYHLRTRAAPITQYQ